MSKKRTDILVVFFLLMGSLQAQVNLDSIQRLDEVIVTDRQLKNFTTGQKQWHLSDSVLLRNPSSMADLLLFNTPIQINQNGYGMVASPAFRGTTAQQTAVVWNGININSQFNGQTDLNTILSNSANEVVVKPGGGSVVYGSGAIGGSIHLNNELNFTPKQSHLLQTSYGSFETFDHRYQFKKASEKVSFSFNFSRLISENDFPTPGRNLPRNTNASVERNELQTSFGVKLNQQNKLTFHVWYQNNDRNFPILRVSENPSAYHNEDLRNLVEWQAKWNKFSSFLRVASFWESFTFQQNTNRPESTTNNAVTNLIRHDLMYETKHWLFNTLIEANTASSSGDDLTQDTRNILATSFLAKRKWNNHFITEVSLRQEVTNLYNSPLLYSFGNSIEFFKGVEWKLNYSKNFRIPTFNDLFWQTSGNTDLLPENAQQIESGLHLSYKKWQFGFTYFYQDIRNMIRWIPNESSVWRPINTDHVVAKGAEVEISFQHQIGEVFLQWNAQYAYTSSTNQATGNQLRFIPFHKANSSLSASWKQWNIDTQVVYIGEVFTRTSNNPDFTIPEYILQNIGVHYQVKKLSGLEIGIRTLNIGNKNYVGIGNLPMPGRSFVGQVRLVF